MKPFVGQRQTRPDRPRDIRTHLRQRVTIRVPLPRLEDHHRRDHIGRYRRAAPTRPKRILEQPIGNNRLRCSAKKRVHQIGRHEMAAPRRRVQQLSIGSHSCAAPPQSEGTNPKSRTPTAYYSSSLPSPANQTCKLPSDQEQKL